MSVIFFDPSPIISIQYNDIKLLKTKALESPLKRARICLHFNNTDTIQEMLIAFCKNSYIRPHRHIDKTESFHIIEGKGVVFFFDDDGNVIKYIYIDNSNTFIYKLSEPLWHTVIPITEFLVIHEVTTGPFIKDESTYAVWAPKDDEYHEIQLFTEKLLTIIS